MRHRTNSSGLTPAEELRCWAMMFEVGRDYFGDLHRLKLRHAPEDEEFLAMRGKPGNDLARPLCRPGFQSRTEKRRGQYTSSVNREEVPWKTVITTN